MDPALLRDLEKFKKKTFATPVVESNKRKEAKESGDDPSKKKIKKDSAPPKPRVESNRDLFARSTGASGTNFGILAKIINHMKIRYQQEDNEALSLQDLLDDTNQLDIGHKQRMWLETGALRDNPKVRVVEEGTEVKYAFKPPFPDLTDRKTLMRLLLKYDTQGKGGIALEDLLESLPRCEKILKSLGDKIITITRAADKKKVIFYNDKTIDIQIDEEFKKAWRSIAVDGLDEQKIEEYLQRQGITSMQDLGGANKKNQVVQKRKKPSTRKSRFFKKTNDHVGDLLQDYSDKA